MIEMSQIKLIDLIPSNMQSDSKVQAAAEVIDFELRAVTLLIPNLSILHRIDLLSSDWIDQLAWQFHVDFYDPSLPLDQRRELVKNSIAWHKRKGTPSAIEELMSIVFGDGKVEEWFEYGGQPYFFRVITSNFSATTEHALRFLRLVNSVKNTRSWLDTVIIRLVEDTSIYLGNVVHLGDHITLTQEGLQT